MALPLIIGAGVWGYRAYQAYRAYRVYQMAQGLALAARALPKPEVCFTCRRDNLERCQKLYRQIVHYTKDLNERAAKVATNPRGLPWVDPLKKYGKYASDIFGHILLFIFFQNQLKNFIAEYKRKNCGPLPPGAEEAANMDIPMPLVPPGPRPPDVNP